jgi:hypothetical protein
MPIGPQVPGVVTTVTPDDPPPVYYSSQGPAPDGLVVADDVLAVHLMALNIEARVLPNVPGAVPSAKIYALEEAAAPISGSSGSPSDWARSSIATYAPNWYQGIASDALLMFNITPLIPPNGLGKINSIEMSITTAIGHNPPYLPQYMPTIQLLSASYDSNALTQHAIFTDTTSGEFYEDPSHVVGSTHSVGGILTTPLTLSAGRKYWLAVIGEYGTNSAAGLMVNSVRFEVIP